MFVGSSKQIPGYSVASVRLRILDRKSTRLNSSHSQISYAVFCLKKNINFGRQSIPTFVPGHRLNSGPFGTMGVGLPFSVGAKAAKPNSQVICLHGDGSFAQNAMQLDTAVRHKLPLLCIISLNGGWTADPQGNKPGRYLGYTRHGIMAQGLRLPCE